MLTNDKERLTDAFVKPYQHFLNHKKLHILWINQKLDTFPKSIISYQHYFHDVLIGAFIKSNKSSLKQEQSPSNSIK